MAINRKDILLKASEATGGSRATDYGSVEDNFHTIACLWNDYIRGKPDGRRTITSTDVAAMMALMKIARIASGHAKDDNWIDLAGYAACGGEVQSRSLEFKASCTQN